MREEIGDELCDEDSVSTRVFRQAHVLELSGHEGVKLEEVDPVGHNLLRGRARLRCELLRTLIVAGH